jgi:TonB family protein
MPTRLSALVLLLAGALFAHDPQVISRVDPVYPERARKMNITGNVRLTVLIGKDGTPRRIRTLSGHPMLIPAAYRAVRRWRWLPDRVEQVTAVDVWVGPLVDAPSRRQALSTGED